jgi:hypothetical protein
MKKLYFSFIFLPICVFAILSGTIQLIHQQTINNVAVQFVVSNRWVNNVYVDNFLIGTQYNYDVAISSVNNIPKDTAFSFFGANSFKIAPKISLVNLGTSITNGFNVVMTSGTYTSIKPVANITAGSGVEIIFDSLTIVPFTPLNIKIYSTWSLDQNRENDTLIQYTYYLPGVKRNVLIEEYTQWNCPPCATNTPYLDQFESDHWDSLCVIRYHTWWPGANNDPMYLSNTIHNSNRVRYYNITSVPNANIDGTFRGIYVFDPPEIQFGYPYYNRLNKGTPVGIHVTDTRIPFDTIKSDITINVYNPLPTGNYRLRVNVIERERTYLGGTNGESIFKDIFRKMYPDTIGIAIPTTVGEYNFTIKYLRESEWLDTLIYTVAYIQNDDTKEILNCDKGRRYSVVFANNNINKEQKELRSSQNKDLNNKYNVELTNSTQKYNILSNVNFELFEGDFPPSGWTVINPDNGKTWEQYSGVNGPLFSGLKCVRINCFDYGSVSQLDYLKSKIYNGIELTDSLKFNWAYALRANSSYSEHMTVQVSTNGGITFPYTIFDKTGANLSTAPATLTQFVPTGPEQWGRFSIAMSNVITSIKQFENEVPLRYDLLQNYPNPFNPSTIISYKIPKTSKVSLKVYDINGRLISILFEGTQNSGNYITQFDGIKLASGIYYCRLSADNFTKINKMVFLK